MLNRNRSARDITAVHDVTSKESFNKVKVRLGEINKHVSDGVNRLLVENKLDLPSQKTLTTDEAKAERNTRRHDSNNTNNHTEKGWRFATESPWTLWHTSGSRKDIHGTPVPDREGRG